MAAHDLYILPKTFHVHPSILLDVAFHNGDSFPMSESAPVIARLKDAQLRSSLGTVSIQNIHTLGKSAAGQVMLLDAKGSMWLSVRTTPNLIELPAAKFISYLQEEGLSDVIAWRDKSGENGKPGRERYSKFAKALITSDKADHFYNTVLGLAIEIVPGKNPAAMRPGTRLPVKVILLGKPGRGLQVEASWSSDAGDHTAVIGRTDDEGRIQVPISSRGRWRLHTLAMQRCAQPKAADWESYWASLTFEVE